jgi:hypothetical protein
MKTRLKIEAGFLLAFKEINIGHLIALTHLLHMARKGKALDQTGNDQLREELLIDASLLDFAEAQAKDGNLFCEIEGLDGKSIHRFKLVAYTGNDNGFKGAAFVEVDESGHFKRNEQGQPSVRFCFPGADFTSRADLRAVLDAKEGYLSDQLESVGGFLEEALKSVESEVGELDREAICIGSHSFGSTNAVYAAFLLREQGYTVHSRAFEPCGMANVIAHMAIAAYEKHLVNLQDMPAFIDGLLPNIGVHMGNTGMTDGLLFAERLLGIKSATEVESVRARLERHSLAKGIIASLREGNSIEESSPASTREDLFEGQGMERVSREALPPIDIEDRLLRTLQHRASPARTEEEQLRRDSELMELIVEQAEISRRSRALRTSETTAASLLSESSSFAASSGQILKGLGQTFESSR